MFGPRPFRRPDRVIEFEIGYPLCTFCRTEVSLGDEIRIGPKLAVTDWACKRMSVLEYLRQLLRLLRELFYEVGLVFHVPLLHG